MISERLKKIICRELALEDFPLEATTTAPNVPGWDSLRHVSILDAIEKDYGITFGSLEVMRLRTVGDLQTLIDRKQPKS